MKNKKIIHRSYDDTIVDSITCDICKKIYSGENWERETFSALETQVKLRTGNSFPEGSWGKEIVFDICPDCFMEKLVPILKELGAEPTEAEWGW